MIRDHRDQSEQRDGEFSPGESGSGDSRGPQRDDAAPRRSARAGAEEAPRTPESGTSGPAKPGDAPADGAEADGPAASEQAPEPTDRHERTSLRKPSATPRSTGSTSDASTSERLEKDEPLLAARAHRPPDLLRFLLGILGMAVVLGIAYFAHATTAGLEEDIDKGAGQAPPLVISFTAVISSVAVLLVPVAFAIERLIKRDGLRIADGVLAAVLAHGVSLAVALWVAKVAPVPIQDALTKNAPSGGLTDPVHNYLGPVIAYMTAVGMARRPRWRVLLWVVLLTDALSILASGYMTTLAIVLTLLIGWTVAYGTLYAVGSPNVRPTGQGLLAGLRRVGFRPVSALHTEEPGVGSGESERGRQYLVTLEDGAPLDVTIVDREQQAHGFFYRAWRRLALRGITQRRSTQSLRQALEQEALLAYAAIAAGANAPKLIATSELGPDAVMLVYEHTGGRPLEALPDTEITDELMCAAWQQVRALQSRRIAHRRLTGEALLVDSEGTVYLTDLRGGEIAAGDLVLLMDVAQLLTTFGLRVGADRAVSSAVETLGPDAVADSLPLLQPIALNRSTRTTLRRLSKERADREREAVLAAAQARKAAKTHPADSDPEGRKAAKAERSLQKRQLEQALEDAREEDLLTQIREEVLRIRPEATIVPARLERIKPRTLVTSIAGVFAAYFLLTSFAHVNLPDLVGDAHWGWVAAAAVFSASSYLAAALSLLGFVPEKVPFWRTVSAQVAGSFVKLVAPAAIGGVALNTRFLQRAGLRPGHAVASVGVSQIFVLTCHITLLLCFGYLTGKEQAASIPPSRTVIAGLLTVAVLVLIVTAVPALRKFVTTRVRSLFAGVVPRMLDVVQRPKKLASGIGGMLMLTVVFVACLYSSIQAFGGEVSFVVVATVFLAGNALGSAAPTPGGLGAVEGALFAGLTTIGKLDSATALSAVLLYRALTFWLPVLPGWIAFSRLTSRKAL
ncbi:flippase-like domain-containing protein [Streptomyces sp. P38-E01]|uniref:Flippase-like domain-containing protein n=1 Tax=Streptomyces tardus TaxID=2780544 RepID=A0A949JN73_9ACTN|nr:lysylphosphatidylglycerol synthetase family protein [Streptomyces tardus]MBU7599259.1 flippase-like domain-containing protein [Streptomyces tardus]